MLRQSNRLMIRLLAGLLGFLALLWLGTFLWQSMENRGWNTNISTYMEGCKPNELRLMWRGKDFFEEITLNLETKTYEGIRTNGVDTFDIETVSSWGRPPLTDQQIDEAKTIFSALPVPQQKWFDQEPFKDQFHVSFYESGHLRVCHYAQDEARPQRIELVKVLGVGARSSDGL